MKVQQRPAWSRTVRMFLALAALLALFLAACNGQERTKRAAETLSPAVDGSLSEMSENKFAYRDLLPRQYPLSMQTLPEPGTLRWRTGVGIPAIGPLAFDWPQQRPGWYLSWSIDPQEVQRRSRSPNAQLDMRPPALALLGMEFVPMVRMFEGELYWRTETLTALSRRNPGRTWLIANEPDVVWQDNTTPEDYAEAYHEAYHAIKAGDPGARIAIGGVSQVTPLRLAYLDRVRAAYEERYGEPIPVDVWNMHAFVLREERDNWGVGIPPGFEDVDTGILWEIEDHDDLHLVENQVRLMRNWMVKNGEGDKPLWITEYGILLPEEYGFAPERVEEFMLSSFDLFERLRHAELGLAVDDGRLVQRWSWFSTFFHLYPMGNLFDIDGHPTPLMESMSRYLDRVSPQRE